MTVQPHKIRCMYIITVHEIQYMHYTHLSTYNQISPGQTRTDGQTDGQTDGHTGHNYSELLCRCSKAHNLDLKKKKNFSLEFLTIFKKARCEPWILQIHG